MGTLRTIGLTIAGIILALAVVVTGGTLVSRYVKTEVVAPDAAAGEFEKARARFAGQQPLIE